MATPIQNIEKGDAMNIYNNVVQLANDKGMNIAQLEKKAGIANGTIGKWKNENNKPLVDTVVKVARALGVTVNRLIKE
jgi:transcriptional regulator with XRE-family HTH domain